MENLGGILAGYSEETLRETPSCFFFLNLIEFKDRLSKTQDKFFNMESSIKTQSLISLKVAPNRLHLIPASRIVWGYQPIHPMATSLLFPV